MACWQLKSESNPLSGLENFRFITCASNLLLLLLLLPCRRSLCYVLGRNCAAAEFSHFSQLKKTTAKNQQKKQNQTKVSRCSRHSHRSVFQLCRDGGVDCGQNPSAPLPFVPTCDRKIQPTVVKLPGRPSALSGPRRSEGSRLSDGAEEERHALVTCPHRHRRPASGASEVAERTSWRPWTAY